MSESLIKLWINSETNTLIPNWNYGGTISLPSLKQGDTIQFEIHWVRSDSGGQFMEEVQMPSGSEIKVAIGIPNGTPSSGFFIYSYGADTVNIPYDATQAQANTLINSLPSIVSAGGVSVSIVNKKTYRIEFNNSGARLLSTCDSTDLRPSTTIFVSRIRTGSVSEKEIQHLRPKLNPVAYSSSFSNVQDPAISIDSIDSITERISISPSPKYGTFTISNGTLTTKALSIYASASDVMSALTSSGLSNSTRVYSVAKSGDFSWDIYRTSGTSETLSVSDAGMVGFSAKSGNITLNTQEVEDLLAGELSAGAVLEVEYSYGGIKQTIYQGNVNIVNDLIEDGVYDPIPFDGFITEAPQDGSLYARKNGNWFAFQEEDNQGITQAFADGRYAQLVDGYATQSWVTSQGYLTSGSLSGYATESWVSTQLNSYATLASPAFSGDPTVPTQLATDNSTRIANTAYVTNAISVASTSGSTQNVVMSVLNQTGSTINAGTVVYVNGANGTNPTVSLAQANSESTSYRTLGITSTSITQGSTGTVVLIGNVSSVDTSAFNEGDQLYLSPTTAGGIVNVKPSAPNHMVYVGVCVRKNANNGVIQVRVSNGFEIEELHNVAIASKADNDLLAYESSSGLWKNKTFSTLGLATQSYVTSQGYITSAALTPYALLAGATFTGKVTTTATASTAPLNIAVSTTAPTTTVAGDIWVGNNNLFFKDSTNTQRAVLNNSTTNTFSAPQIIDTTSNTLAGLRVTQKGSAPSIVVEDSLNPDISAFIVNADGIVGIQRDASTWVPSSGVILDVNGKGSFNATSTYAGLNVGRLTADPTTTASGDVWLLNNNLRYKDYGGTARTIPSLTTMNNFVGSQAIGDLPFFNITQSSNSNVALSVTGVSTFSNPTSSSPYGAVTIYNQGQLPALKVYGGDVTTAEVVVIESKFDNGTALRITNTGNANSLIVEDSANPDTTSFIINNNGSVGIGVATGFTPVGKLDVNGFITSSTASDKTSSTVVATTAFVKSSVVPTIISVSSSPYAITNSLNWNSVIRVTNGSLTTITVPTDATSNVEIGTQIVIIQNGTAQVTIQPSVGVTLMSAGGKTKTTGQYSVCTLIKTASDEWVLGGDLTT